MDMTLISIKRVTIDYGVSRATLYRWLADGRIKAKKIGRSTMIIRASLDTAIDGLPDYQP